MKVSDMYRLKTGNLVCFKEDAVCEPCLVVWVEPDIDKQGAYCEVLFDDGTFGYPWMGRLEVINESR